MPIGSSILRALVGATVTFLAVTLGTASGRAQGPDALAGEIARLERAIAAYDAATRNAKPEPAKQMQHLIDMAKLAGLYSQTNRIQDSWPLAEKLLARMEQIFGPEHPNIVVQLEAVAAAHGLQGRYAEAEKLRKRAIAIVDRAFGRESLQMATSLQGMAQLFRQQDRLEEALPIAARALEITERKLPPGDPQRAVFLSQVADIHMSAKRYDTAEPLLKRALAVVEADSTSPATIKSALTIQYLQSLAVADLARGRQPQAQATIDRAIALSTLRFGPDHVMTGAMLQTLALQLFERDQLDAAERLFRQALPSSEKGGRPSTNLVDNYVGLGLVAFKRRNWRVTYPHLRRASAIGIELDRMAIAGGIAPAQSRIAPRADVYLLAAVSGFRLAEIDTKDAAALRDEAFRFAQHAERSSVGRALAQMSARVRTGQGPLAGLLRERQDLANEWQRLDRLLEAALTVPAADRNADEEKAVRERLSAATTRLEAIDARVRKEFPDYEKLADPAPLSIADVQGLLRPGEVLVYITHRSNQSLVWAIRADKVDWKLVDPGEEDVAKEVDALRCGLDETAWGGIGAGKCAAALGRVWQPGGHLPFDLARAHKLYQSFLAPFATMTDGARLLIATSGPLATLPLHVLVTAPPSIPFPGDAGGYSGAAWLAKRNASTVLPSVASMKALRAAHRPSVAGRPFLGIANPLLEGSEPGDAELAEAARAKRACEGLKPAVASTGTRAGARKQRRSVAQVQLQGGLARGAALREQPPLPETADEICAVARAFGATAADVRLAERTSETEIKQLSNSGALAQYRIVHFATHGALAGQISGNSEPGLVMTPPADATAADDGYLTAPEIAELKLDADWVILSACNTAGAGRNGAEALSGLARAFFYAQARAVLASHWEVYSVATVSLITAAVAAQRQEPGIGRAEALRRGMLGMMTTPEHAHPTVWAPFVLVGEGGVER